jgi:ADP-ribose pyrophosphatase YjhB (NUDIX family)
MFRTTQFVTGDFTPHHCFLPDDTYGLALDALVKACSDVLLLSPDRASLFLGRRKVEPQPDWWFVGGRSKPGDSTQEAAARNVKRELKLAIEPARFETVGNYSFVWEFRQQEPQDHGTADISTVHMVHLSAEEAAACDKAMDPDEYRDSQWIRIEEVLKSDSFHPALQQAVADLVTKLKLEALQAGVSGGKSDKEIAALAKQLCLWHSAGRVRGMDTRTKVIYEDEKYTYVEGRQTDYTQVLQEAPHLGKPETETPEMAKNRARQESEMLLAEISSSAEPEIARIAKQLADGATSLE